MQDRKIKSRFTAPMAPPPGPFCWASLTFAEQLRRHSLHFDKIPKRNFMGKHVFGNCTSPSILAKLVVRIIVHEQQNSLCKTFFLFSQSIISPHPSPDSYLVIFCFPKSIVPERGFVCSHFRIGRHLSLPQNPISPHPGLMGLESFCCFKD